MAYAIINVSGKQYSVEDGSSIIVDRLSAPEGEKITFADVLLISDGKSTQVGKPHVSGAKVTGTVVRHGKADKVYGVQMKPKKRHKKYFGHRQPFTELKIEAIAS